MDIICPECLGEVVPATAATAKCRTHGGVFRILFRRDQPASDRIGNGRQAAAQRVVPSPQPIVQDATPPAALASTLPPAQAAPQPVVQTAPPPPPQAIGSAPGPERATCLRHPSISTRLRCKSCGNPICNTCAFPQPDGSALCPDCGKRRVPATATTAPLGAFGPCKQHPEVAAVTRCDKCQAPVCGTCGFFLPGNVHLCPECATSSSQQISDSRKRNVFISYGLVVVTILSFMALFVAGATGTDDGGEALAGLLGIVIFAASIAGFTLGISAIDRRLSNPWWFWGAMVSNALMLAMMLLLAIVGTLVG
jgi:hypothetical protein